MNSEGGKNKKAFKEAVHFLGIKYALFYAQPYTID
jgi:hypothetical protein